MAGNSLRRTERYKCEVMDSQPKSVGLVWGLAATRRSVCIHQMIRVNSRN